MSLTLRIASLQRDLRTALDRLWKSSDRVLAARRELEEAIARGEVIYGINTGFGCLADRAIDSSQMEQLQRNLIMSHAVGVGAPVPREIARRILQLKLYTLGLGYSAISLPPFRRLLEFERRELIPAIPSQGSVGASGDLAPLAHLALPLLGEGEFCDRGEAGPVLIEEGLPPIALSFKDGLAIVNGTQFTTGYGCYVLERTSNLLKVCDIVAAMSLTALLGSLAPFDARIQEVRPHPGQQEVAQNIRSLLAGRSGEPARLQDPYSLRCVPQVHGASRDALRHVEEVFEREINGVADNPLLFEGGVVLSGGNFHGQPLALALDYGAIALAELASISERRCDLLLRGWAGLPPLLIEEAGLNSGFMIMHSTAASLVSENKVLCHPASVDSIPTSLGQEDHVSMGSVSATKLLPIFENVKRVLAIELLLAAQGCDYRAEEMSDGVRAAHRRVREEISHCSCDRCHKEELETALALVESGRLVAAVEGSMGALL